MTVGNLGALLQRDVKRMLAYSSIAHAGYLLVAFTAFPTDGIAAACFYTAAYAAMNVGAFAVITQISGYDEHARTIDDYTGLALKRPVLAGTARLLPALAHRNPLHRRLLRQVLRLLRRLHAGNVWLAVIGLLNSGIACFYYLRLLAALYTRPAHDTERIDVATPITIPAAIALTFTAVATLLLGIAPNRILGLAQRSADVTMHQSTPLPQPTTADTVSTTDAR